VQEYNETARAIIDAIPVESLNQFAFFGGPGLDKVVFNGNVALLGDASHRTFASPPALFSLTLSIFFSFSFAPPLPFLS
jgi:hypothetical protein